VPEPPGTEAPRTTLAPREAPTEIPVNMLATQAPASTAVVSRGSEAQSRLVMPKLLYDSSWQNAPREFGALKEAVDGGVQLHANALRQQGLPVDETKLHAELTLKMHNMGLGEAVRTSKFGPPINEDDVKLQKSLATSDGMAAYDNIITASRNYLNAHQGAYGNGSAEVNANIKQAAAVGETHHTQGELIARSEVQKLGIPADTPADVRGLVEGKSADYYKNVFDGTPLPQPTAEQASDNLLSVVSHFGSRNGQLSGDSPLHQAIGGYTMQMKQQMATANEPPPFVLARLMMADRTEAGPRFPGLALMAHDFLTTNGGAPAQ
jgi:hypothetical protein